MCIRDRITYFNGMYKLPIAPYPSIIPVAQDVQKRSNVENCTLHSLAIKRLEEFKKILLDEISEVDDIMDKLRNYAVEDIEILTDLADWLGDIQVYCHSEMLRWGIPHAETMNIIMDSNFSKLGADGLPILAEGKVQKGPFYWKPEPKLRTMLEEKIGEAIYTEQYSRIPLGDD